MRLRALAVVITILASAVLAARQVPAGEALERYHRGEHEAAVAALNPRELQVATFTASLEPWIVKTTEGADQRTLVAASFALDVVWAATRRADDESNVGWSILLEPQTKLRMAGLSADRALMSDLAATLAVVAWGCSQLDARESRGTTDVTAAERLWWLASVGMLQNAAAWRALEA